MSTNGASATNGAQHEHEWSDSRLKAAVDHQLQGRSQEAVEVLDGMIASDPEYLEAYLLRAACLFDLQRYPEAVADMDKTMELDPTRHARVLAKRARAKEYMGQHGEAFKDYDEAAALDPKIASVFEGRGRCLAEFDRHEEALEDFNRVIELDGHVALAHLLRGQSLHELKRREEAMEDYHKAVEMSPQSGPAYVCRGACYAELGFGAEALADFDKALALDGRDIHAHMRKGQVLAALRRYEEAARSYERVLEIGGPERVVEYVRNELKKIT